jgi:hypothetical protein
MQVMLLGFVLLGRSLEESARLKASSDMNELIVSANLYLCIVPPRSICLSHFTMLETEDKVDNLYFHFPQTL